MGDASLGVRGVGRSRVWSGTNRQNQEGTRRILEVQPMQCMLATQPRAVPGAAAGRLASGPDPGRGVARKAANPAVKESRAPGARGWRGPPTQREIAVMVLYVSIRPVG